jgi:gas vesicle protein
MKKSRDEVRHNDEVQYDYNLSTTKYNPGTKDKLTYLLVGGGIGALVALLFAPKSGSELRTDITDAARKGVDKTRETASQLGEKSNEYINTAKQRAGDIYSRTGGVLNAAKSEFGKRTDSGAENEQTRNRVTAGDIGASRTTAVNFDDKDEFPVA